MIFLNLPNLLTALRLLLIPFILFFLFSANERLVFILIGFLLYLLAIITDFFDGLIARQQNLTSKFGAFFDSLVDKIIVLSLFFSFALFTFWQINVVFIVLILAREIFLTAMRIWALLIGYSLKTEYHGKIKTVLQMFTQITLWFLLMVYCYFTERNQISTDFWLMVFKYLPNALLFSVMVFSIYSGVTYLLQNKNLFRYPRRS